MSATVFVGIGSNQDREAKIVAALAMLRDTFGEVEISPVYNTAAVGFDGSDFLNLVAAFETELGAQAVVDVFRRIEDDLGRDRSLPKFASRPIDLDILLYDNLVMNVPGIAIPRPEILEQAFVLKPLQDLAPERLHPELGETFAALWQRMEARAPRMEVIALTELETGAVG